MEGLMAAVIGLVICLVLLFAGMQIFGAVLIGGMTGMVLLQGLGRTETLLALVYSETCTTFTWGVIPLFILMGYIIYYLGITEEVYKFTRAWIGSLSGGLAMATSLACAIFGAASGSSTAAAAMFGKVSVGEMVNYRYDKRLAAGVTAASGTLAALIPPSLLVVIYGLLAEQSIGKLLIGGLLPGIVSVAIYMGMIWIRCKRNPNLGPPIPQVVGGKERFSLLILLWPIFALFILVILGIYIGIFTPTEAGGIGAFGAFAIGLAMRRLTWNNFKLALRDTVRTTAMIFAVLICIQLLTLQFAYAGLTLSLNEFVLGLAIPRYAVLGCMAVIYILLGCFIGTLGMLTLTVPIFVPVVAALGFDSLWFGIIVIKMCEIAMITPPIGINVYIVNSVNPDIPTVEIFRGVLPFFFMDILTVVVLTVFPQIILFLPSQM